MRLLILSATQFEIQPLIQFLEKHFISTSTVTFQKGNLEVSLLITGVGQASTAYGLTRTLTGRPVDLVVHAGIAGARALAIHPIGSVVQVVADVFADLGVEEQNGDFIPVTSLGLLDENQFPYSNGWLRAPEESYLPILPKVTGRTVNRVPGTALLIQQLEQHFSAEVETMESASTFLVCLSESVPFLQIRSISNQIEPRNRANWNIPLAIERLNEVLIDFIRQW